jgi:hypothetical protein
MSQLATQSQQEGIKITKHHYGVTMTRGELRMRPNNQGSLFQMVSCKVVVTVVTIEAVGESPLKYATAYGFCQTSKYIKAANYQVIQGFAECNGYTIDINEQNSVAPIEIFKWHLTNDWGINKDVLKRNFEDNDRGPEFELDGQLIFQRGQNYTLPEICVMLGWLTTSHDDCVLDCPEEYSALEVYQVKQKIKRQLEITNRFCDMLKETGLNTLDLAEIAYKKHNRSSD